MQIDEFVESTLIQIIEGVRSAQKKSRIPGRHATESDLVNPRVLTQADSGPKGKDYITINRDLVHMIDFDIAVTTTSDKAEKGGAGIKVAGIGGFGGDLANSSSVSEVSRIKFQVPVVLPSSDHDGERDCRKTSSG